MTLASPDITGDYNWKVEQDLYGSDHFPIIINESNNVNFAPDDAIRFNVKKADWKLFNLYTVITESEYTNIEDIDDLVEKFNNHIKAAATASIPIVKNHKYKPIPWWNEECKKTHLESNILSSRPHIIILIHPPE